MNAAGLNLDGSQMTGDISEEDAFCGASVDVVAVSPTSIAVATSASSPASIVVEELVSDARDDSDTDVDGLDLEFGGASVHPLQRILVGFNFTGTATNLTTAQVTALTNFQATGGLSPGAGAIITRNTVILGVAQTNLRNLMNAAGLNLDGTPMS